MKITFGGSRPNAPQAGMYEPIRQLRRLLRHHRLAEQVEAGAAIFGRRADAPQARRARLLLQRQQQFLRHGEGIVRQGVVDRLDLVLHEAPRGLLQQPEFLGQFPCAKRVHRPISLLSGGAAASLAKSGDGRARTGSAANAASSAWAALSTA